jgi:5-methyltetrahydrofolate--homocysteine methyltransferase
VGVNTELLERAGTTEEEMMAKAVGIVQASVDAPLVIDSNSSTAIEAGLRECEGKALINSVPAERERMEQLFSLAKQYGAAVVILPISHRGIPDTAGGRFKLAEEVKAHALKAGIQPEDILADPLLLAVSAAQEQLPVTLQTLKMLKESGYQTILGLSNVSFGLPERSELNAAFLSMAVAAGLDAVILNPADENVMRALSAARVLTMRDRGGKEYVERFRVAPVTVPKVAAAPREGEGIKERISGAILSGDREGIVKLIEEALQQGIAPIEINLSILTPALEEVGSRFEKKEIFLPQMILAAETVQNAFGQLKRAMKGEKMPTKGKIVMATVRGDVHDIGKNICCTVLENHGYEIIDCGRNVPAEVIAETAARAKADIIGLSALMTTTISQMEVVISEMKNRGMKQKVMVGGAVVTPAFARKIGADGHAKDAGGIVKLVKQLMGNT